jgi:hypothetical protein
VTWRVLDAAFAFAFALAAAVQLNDPDPLAWVLVYAAATLTCAVSAWGVSQTAATRWRYVPALLGVICIAWGLSLLPVVVRHPPALADLFADVGMMQRGVEETREMLGLFMVAAWMLGVAVRARRVRAGAT